MSKKKNIDDSGYFYASARLKSLETKNITREKFEKMIEAKSINDAVSVLIESEYGEGVNTDALNKAGKAFDYERLFLSEQKKVYGLLDEMIPDASVLKFFKYQYDCHNIKSILKSEIAGKSPDGLLTGLGTVGAETAKISVRERTFEGYPANMAEAAESAIDAYHKNRDPMIIDITLDKACFADMLDAAKESGSDFFIDLAKKKTDLANIMSSIRIMRMNANIDLLKKTLFPGGYLAESFFVEAFDAQENKLFDALKYTAYSAVGEAASNQGHTPLSGLEKLCEEIYCEKARESRYIPYGIEVAVGYAAGKETEIKNVRIVMAGKEAGISGDTVRERLRAVYAR